MKKTTKKPDLLVELMNRKIEQQKTGKKTDSFQKFQPGKSRYSKTSPVGPAWGGRKGN